MNTGTALIFLGALFSFAGMYFMIRIAAYLKSRGEKISWLLFRLRWFQYMSRYSELTIKENGEPGALLKWYKVTMLISLLLVVAGALLLNR